MKTLSLADYAATHGVSKQAATRWKHKGALAMNGDLVEVDRSDAKMKGAGLGRFRVSAHGGRREKGVRGVVDRPGLVDAPAAMTLEERRYHAELDAYRTAEPFGLGVQIEREIARLSDATSKGQRLEFAELEDLADTVVFWELQDEREILGWLEWPERVAPVVANELGIPAKATAVARILTERVLERLESELLRGVEITRATLAKVPSA